LRRRRPTGSAVTGLWMAESEGWRSPEARPAAPPSFR
jgi:hypothetical protein